MTNTIQEKLIELIKNETATKAVNLTMSNYAVVVQTEDGIFCLPYTMKNNNNVNTLGYNFGEWQKLPDLPLIQKEVSDDIIRSKLKELLNNQHI